jgi:ElaB/YqjD/DUF883 family membrane-anchored ribosome-binding protein
MSETPVPATTTVTREQLVADMKTVIADAEELLKATAGAAGDRIAAARARAELTVRNAKAKLADLNAEMVDRAKDAARTTDDYVHEHPWQAIGLAAAAGLVAGLLISRR